LDTFRHFDLAHVALAFPSSSCHFLALTCPRYRPLPPCSPATCYCLHTPQYHASRLQLTHIHPPTTPLPLLPCPRLPYPPRETRFPHRRQLAQTRPRPIGVPYKVHRADAGREDVDDGYPDELVVDFVEEVVGAVFAGQGGGRGERGVAWDGFILIYQLSAFANGYC
jgi:hypothetical protein